MRGMLADLARSPVAPRLCALRSGVADRSRSARPASRRFRDSSRAGVGSARRRSTRPDSRCGACAGESRPAAQIAAEAPVRRATSRSGCIVSSTRRRASPDSTRGRAPRSPRSRRRRAQARRQDARAGRAGSDASRDKLRERGFHPAGELAHAVAARLGARLVRTRVRAAGPRDGKPDRTRPRRAATATCAAPSSRVPGCAPSRASRWWTTW